MCFEYGLCQKEVTKLFEDFEKGEMSFLELKEKVLNVVKDVEEGYELLVEQSAGEDW